MPRKKKEEVKEEVAEKVKVECICSNVHLGPAYDHLVLRASRKSQNDNWSNGTTCMVDKALADEMVEKAQVRIV